MRTLFHKLFNQRGFSLPEAMIGMLIMGGVGVAGMKLAQNMKTGTVSVKGSNDLNRTMMEIRNLLNNPKVCSDNLVNKSQDQVMGGIIDTTAAVATGSERTHNNERNFLKFASGSNIKVANGNYIITNIKISKVDAARKRAYVAFTFEDTDKKGVVTKITKNVSMFVKATGTRVDECINPAELSAEAISLKLCFDADPMNFDVDPNNDNTICTDNNINLKAQVKALYCQSHPFFKFAGGKCLPLDSGVDCGNGRFIKGYDSTGKAICYSAPTAPATPLPTGCVDSTWTPSDPGQVCSSAYVTETSNCNNTRTSTTVRGTKTDGSCVSCTSSWTPSSDPSTVCSDQTVTETDGCGNSRNTMMGTKNCAATGSGCTIRLHPAMHWGRYPNQCQSNPGPPGSTQAIPNGGRLVMNAANGNGQIEAVCSNGFVTWTELSSACCETCRPD